MARLAARRIETLRGSPQAEKGFLNGVLSQVRRRRAAGGRARNSGPVRVVDLGERLRITGDEPAEQCLLRRRHADPPTRGVGGEGTMTVCATQDTPVIRSDAANPVHFGYVAAADRLMRRELTGSDVARQCRDHAVACRW